MKCSMFLHVRSHLQASTMKTTIIPHLLPRWTAQRAEIILEGILKDLEGNNRTFQVLIQKINFCKFLGKLDCL